jgi:hypothetical protein
VAKAIEEGVIPRQAGDSFVEDNIAWGKRRLAALAAALVAGETITISRADVVMLVLFLASVVVARRSIPRPVIVYQATH